MDGIRFPELVQVKLPEGATDALDRIAGREHRTRAEVIGQCLLAICRSEMAEPAEARQ